MEHIFVLTALVLQILLKGSFAFYLDEESSAKIASEIQEFFGKEIDRIEHLYKYRMNELKKEMERRTETLHQEIQELKLELLTIRQEESKEIFADGKDFKDIKNQFNRPLGIAKTHKEKSIKTVIPLMVSNEPQNGCHPVTGILRQNRNKKATESSVVSTDVETIRSGINETKQMNVTRANSTSINTKSVGDHGDKSKTGRIRQISIPSGTKVAFFARTNVDTPTLQKNQDIVFNDVVTNIGGAYHNHHGTFVTPEPGVYVFFASVLAHGQHCHAKIVKNGERLAVLTSDRSQDAASQVVIVELKQGDIVAVQNYYHDNIVYHGEHSSTFAGFLLYQDFSSSQIVGK